MQHSPSGVLHIPSEGTLSSLELEDQQAQRQRYADVPIGSSVDWKLSDFADAVGRGVK